jgi:hypothetical protein
MYYYTYSPRNGEILYAITNIGQKIHAVQKRFESKKRERKGNQH